MINLARLAFRSLLRNRRRSVMTLGAVALGVAVVIFAHGFGEGLVRMMVRMMLENRLGAIQVHAVGWLESQETAPLKLDIADADAVAARIRKVPGVAGVAPRIRFAGLISNQRTSSIVLGEAIDPVRELEVCPARANEATDGTFVTATKPGAGVIGAELSRALEVKAGGTLTLSASGREGAANALDLEVGGVARGAASLFESKRMVTVPLPWAQQLLQMEGRVTELAVRVDDLDAIPAVAAAIQREVGPTLEVSRWDQVMPFLKDATNRLTIVLRGVSAVLFFIVVFGVVNTMLMNVYERTREIGTMLAVGLRRRQILALFLAEAAAIGVVGGVIGAGLGLALVALTGAKGIALTPPGAAFAQLIHPIFRLDLAAGAVVVAVIGALLAAAWPARKASLMNPVEALRTL